METFVDMLREECKKRVELRTGKPCDDAAASDEFDNLFKRAEIDSNNKSKILKKYKEMAADAQKLKPLIINNSHKIQKEIGEARHYQISKKFAIALAIAFQFETLEEFNSFLARAGHCLSDIDPYDKIIIDLISIGKFSVYDANLKLDHHKYPPLTSRRKLKKETYRLRGDVKANQSK